MTKRDKELLRLARQTLLDTWYVLTQAGSKKVNRDEMIERVCDIYEEIDSYLKEKDSGR